MLEFSLFEQWKLAAGLNLEYFKSLRPLMQQIKVHRWLDMFHYICAFIVSFCFAFLFYSFCIYRPIVLLKRAVVYFSLVIFFIMLRLCAKIEVCFKLIGYIFCCL